MKNNTIIYHPPTSYALAPCLSPTSQQAYPHPPPTSSTGAFFKRRRTLGIASGYVLLLNPGKQYPFFRMPIPGINCLGGMLGPVQEKLSLSKKTRKYQGIATRLQAKC
jgi:hypothetical protein